jgi:hypothetical protein
MKRYLAVIAAVIIAICAVAFTQPAKHLNMVTFEYNPPGGTDYSQSSVENKSNWTVGAPSCSGDDDKACTLEVLSTETTNNGTQLGSGVSITASLGGDAGDYYVSGGTNISSFDNKD